MVNIELLNHSDLFDLPVIQNLKGKKELILKAEQIAS